MTSQLTTALLAVPPNGGPPGPSADDLTELERELDLYLAFWAQVRGERAARSELGMR